jgi:hypothetical protein
MVREGWLCLRLSLRSRDPSLLRFVFQSQTLLLRYFIIRPVAQEDGLNCRPFLRGTSEEKSEWNANGPRRLAVFEIIPSKSGSFANEIRVSKSDSAIALSYYKTGLLRKTV